MFHNLGTVDYVSPDRIVALQQRKTDLANIALSDEGDIAGLEVDELEFLLGDTSEPLAA